MEKRKGTHTKVNLCIFASLLVLTGECLTQADVETNTKIFTVFVNQGCSCPAGGTPEGLITNDEILGKLQSRCTAMDFIARDLTKAGTNMSVVLDELEASKAGLDGVLIFGALGNREYKLAFTGLPTICVYNLFERLISSLTNATDLVISHYHGDHIPLVDANPYQLKPEKATNLPKDIRIWAKGLAGLSPNMRNRAYSLSDLLDKNLPNAEGKSDGSIAFSKAMPHGQGNNSFGKVMMTKIADAKEVFVHASDIQLLDRGAVLQILDWHPDIVLVSGPPLYLPPLSDEKREIAWENALSLSRATDILILDHHMIRSEEGIVWLRNLSFETGKSVVCGADFMKKPRLLLEAWRKQLYKDMPVDKDWHRNYAEGKVDFEAYREWRGYRV